MEKKFDFGKLWRGVPRDPFSLISWSVTALIVAALLGVGFWWIQIGRQAPSMPAQAPAASDGGQISVTPPPATPATIGSSFSIGRQLQLKTSISSGQKFDITDYQVVTGDSLFGIAKQFSIKPETILYSNKSTLNDNPENLKPGMDLTIPPVDGVLYTWQPGDSLKKVADTFKAKSDDILNWPGNNFDLTNPQIKPGTQIMIPGGQRQLIDWTQFIPTISRGVTGAGTGTSNFAGAHQCGGGPVGPVSVWPVMNEPHTISGNDYVVPTHLGIDITGHLGDPVVAAGSGVVVMAQGGNNYGYGNVIQIDHGNGYATIYAHLSQINVSVCAGVVAGQVIGAVGATGNATGPHLHFEVRFGGGNKNPWDFVH